MDIRQLYPGSPRPLRWNILQVPRRIEPGRYRSMVAELFANAGRMGARQLGFMRRALTELYFEGGRLDRRSQAAKWSDWGICRMIVKYRSFAKLAKLRKTIKMTLHPGTLLESLSTIDLQALAVYRSKQLDVSKWVDRLRTYKEKLERDQASRTSLEGVLLRLEQFAEGHMARQYGPAARDAWGRRSGAAG